MASTDDRASLQGFVEGFSLVGVPERDGRMAGEQTNERLRSRLTSSQLVE